MIGIIFIGDLKYCPYLNKYTDELEKQGLAYEVLFWSRENDEFSRKINYFSFNYESKLSKLGYLKVFDFYRYRLWLKKRLSDRRYDKLILLSTLSGMIISDILLRQFSRKYIFDIRDYSYEYLAFFKYIESKLINNSYFTAISSEGFKEFLPGSDSYELVHNYNRKDMGKKFKKRVDLKPLNVVWIGSVRYFEHQKKVIDHLKNDCRFHMVYHGTGPEIKKYTSYCNANSINNITFTGKYDNKEKYKLLLDADILNNTYNSNKIMETKYAISNKFYDGMIYGVPQLVETNTFKHEIVKKSGVGFGIDVNDVNFADKLYKEYMAISETDFNNNVQIVIKKILDDDSKFINKVIEFINFD